MPNKQRKSTKINRKSKFKNKLDRKAWRYLWAGRPFGTAIKVWLWQKNRTRLGLGKDTEQDG